MQGNLFGTTPSGREELGNLSRAIYISQAAHGNVIGGQNAGARNIIAGNGGYGIELTQGATGNQGGHDPIPVVEEELHAQGDREGRFKVRKEAGL